VAPWSVSKTLEEFLSSECEAERAALLAENPVRAFYTSSLSYCGPALVPTDKFRTVVSDVMLQVLERAVPLPDHFAVAGAFEICGDWVSRDSRFEAVGVKLLDQLLSDMAVLKEKCTFYAAIFAMTLARLAQHQTLRRKPPFWRRVTAAAHASLVVRACGSNNADNLFEWVMEHSGKAFLFSALLEGVQEPRWKPDWLTTNHLVADAFGRADASVNKIPEQARPRAWVERITKAREWIADNHLELFCVLPAIGESARKKQPAQEETYGFRPYYQKFCDGPNADTLLMCGPGFHTVGVTKEALGACHAVMSQLRKDGSRWNEGDTRYVLQTLSSVSVQMQDAALADSVAEFCIEKTRELVDGDSTLEIVCRLIECASANPNHVDAMKVLASRLEAVGFLAPASALIDLYDSLSNLQLLDDTLSRCLGKAMAASRLGHKAA